MMRSTTARVGIALGLTLAGSAAMAPVASAYGPGTGNGTEQVVNVSQGPAGQNTTVTVTGSGFAGGEKIDFTVSGPSGPKASGSTYANPDGTFSATVALPSGLPAGQHTIVATGESSGTTAAATFTLPHATSSANPCAATKAAAVHANSVHATTIVLAACLSTLPSAAPSGTVTAPNGAVSVATATPTVAASASPSGLAFTGTDALATSVAGGALIAVGGSLVLTVRRRRSA